MGGFVVGIVELRLPLANFGFGSLDDAAFFRNMLARTIERMAGISQLLINSFQLGIHLFTAFLSTADVGLCISVLGGELFHPLLVVLNAVFVAFHFRFQFQPSLLFGADLCV